MLSLLQLLLPLNETYKVNASQAVFYLIMLGLSAWSIYSLRKHANETSWEENWTNHTSTTIDDDIGVEHGSVVELCQVVATKPEHFADILPGIMVTLGLLGTFFGLAQSLGQAALTISSSLNQLASTSSNFGSMENALTGMIGMLQGMGTQFKTSIWGIVWFLVLRYFYGWLGFENKRLKWTISKMRTEHQTKQDCDDKFMTSLFDRLIDKLEENSKSLNEILSTHNTSLTGNIDTRIQSIEKKIGEQSQASITAQNNCIFGLQQALTAHTGEQFSALQKTMTDDNKKLIQALQDNTTAITSTSDGLISVLNAQATGIVNKMATNSNAMISSQKENFGDLQKSLTKHTSELFETLKNALSGYNNTLTQAVRDNTTALTKTSEDTKSELINQTRDVMNKMDSQNKELMAFTKQCQAQFATLIRHAESTADNTKQFTATIKTFTTDIQDSIDNITTAAGRVKDSASKLSVVVSNLDAKIGAILGDMSSAITDTISKMNSSFNENIVKTEKALTASAQGISVEVQKMSKELGSKIATFDQTMKAATGQLSTTIISMQDNIKEVLGSIKTELSSTVKEMNDGFSENLRKNAMTFNASVSSISNAVESMSKTMDSKLNEFSRMMSSSTGDLKETIKQMRTNIDSILSSLKTDIGSTIKSMNSMIDKSTTSLEQSVIGISTAASTMESQIKTSFKEFNESMKTLVIKQDKSLQQFDSSMKSISQSINEVTGEFKKLKEKLELSLSVVSGSNRDLKHSLESLNDIHKEHKEFIVSLEKAVDKLVENHVNSDSEHNKDE